MAQKNAFRTADDRVEYCLVGGDHMRLQVALHRKLLRDRFRQDLGRRLRRNGRDASSHAVLAPREVLVVSGLQQAGCSDLVGRIEREKEGGKALR
eukprot:COSAG06_NODE_977_length_11246_cov_599.741724_14_plen_95_part_00